jgi:hypothetical protein
MPYFDPNLREARDCRDGSEGWQRSDISGVTIFLASHGEGRTVSEVVEVKA